MRPPSAPTGNGNTKARSRGAIRTHLGRKRAGPRSRLKDSTLERISAVAGTQRHHQEDLFDRLQRRFEGLFSEAGEKLRQFLRRDLLQRDNPTLTFRTGDITSAGTLACAGCGWTIVSDRTTVLPPCPHCSETAFRKIP